MLEELEFTKSYAKAKELTDSMINQMFCSDLSSEDMLPVYAFGLIRLSKSYIKTYKVLGNFDESVDFVRATLAVIDTQIEGYIAEEKK